MKIYLVGGAVRDKLLGIEPKERDWVVVGSSAQEMKKNGFKQVGKDFPVFIHPKSGEEYALARTERKAGHGYTGFEFDANSDVTLEEDLERRDLTINAIAEDESGELIDPFRGEEDIKNKRLRHVSNAFSEDPLRVLRLARFMVKFPEFSVVPTTMDMVKKIVDSGELAYLTGERVWLEIYKSNHIGRFYTQLEYLRATEKIVGICMINKSQEMDFEKKISNGLSKKIHQISYFIKSYIDDVDKFCDELKIPNEYRDLAKTLKRCELDILNYVPERGEYDRLLELINKLDIRKTERLKSFFECIDISDERKIFFESFIDKIKNYRLTKEDQEKSKDEIIKLVRNKHREIAQDHILDYLHS
tara:strand:+ start:69 stop:1148 length:1080 start_codon:yes stop_codon:yes gene_type:complete